MPESRSVKAPRHCFNLKGEFSVNSLSKRIVSSVTALVLAASGATVFGGA